MFWAPLSPLARRASTGWSVHAESEYTPQSGVPTMLTSRGYDLELRLVEHTVADRLYIFSFAHSGFARARRLEGAVELSSEGEPPRMGRGTGRGRPSVLFFTSSSISAAWSGLSWLSVDSTLAECAPELDDFRVERHPKTYNFNAFVAASS